MKEISLCPNCYCITHTIKGKCGKCEADKIIYIEKSKEMSDYKEALQKAVDYYWKAMDRGEKYNADLPFLKGSSIFRYQDREFDFKDYIARRNG